MLSAHRLEVNGQHRIIHFYRIMRIFRPRIDHKITLKSVNNLHSGGMCHSKIDKSTIAFCIENSSQFHSMQWKYVYFGFGEPYFLFLYRFYHLFNTSFRSHSVDTCSLTIHALVLYFFFHSFLNGHFNISFHTAFNRNNRWTDNIVYSVCIAFAWNKKTMREYFAFLNKMIVKMIFHEAYWISSNRLSTFIYHVVKIECISHVQIYVRQCC